MDYEHRIYQRLDGNVLLTIADVSSLTGMPEQAIRNRLALAKPLSDTDHNGAGRLTARDLTKAGVLTRSQAAGYLQISVRQLDRLKLPRSYLGRAPRYLRRELDEHLARNNVEPRATEISVPRPKTRGKLPLRGKKLDQASRAELRDFLLS